MSHALQKWNENKLGICQENIIELERALKTLNLNDLHLKRKIKKKK